jgi:hypothetical protein
MSVLVGWGRVPGNREVSRPVMRAKRALPEEGVRGGTWFPHGSEAEPSDADEHARGLGLDVEV